MTEKYIQRPCFVSIMGKQEKGLFFDFVERQSYDFAANVPIKRTFALVEMEDGSVKEVLPDVIQFIDGGDFDLFCWGDEDDECREVQN